MTDQAGGRAGPSNVSVDLLREFAFMGEIGFEVSEASRDAVTWRSGHRTFQVSRDWRDGFLDAHFGDDPLSGRLSFGLRQALATIGRPDLWPRHGWQAWEDETVRKYLAELAEIVRDHVQEFLRGPETNWAAAHRLSVDEAEAYWNDMRSRQWRSQANAARASGDWQGLANAYQELIDAGFPLTEAEAARLRVARRKSEAN